MDTNADQHNFSTATSTTNTRVSLQNNNGLHSNDNSNSIIMNTFSPRNEPNNETVEDTTDIVFPNTIKMDDLMYCYRSSAAIPRAVLPFSGLPHTDLRPSACKFSQRGCLLRSWKLTDKKVRDFFIRSTFRRYEDKSLFPVPPTKVKSGISLVDTKLVRCSNRLCRQILEDGTEGPVHLHYCCYLNMLHKNKIDHIEFDVNKDKDFDEEELKVIDNMRTTIDAHDIILPVCGKKCYNMVLKRRNTKGGVDVNKTKGLKKTTSIVAMERWDNDSRDGSKTSEHVIVDWLTSGENAEKYFGGSHGPNNIVNGIRKDTYHTRLSNMIRMENGQIRSATLVKAKIEHILQSYKYAREIVEQSGGGLEHAEFTSFMDHVHDKYCKWYSVLHTVLASRPNMYPAYTNEDISSDDSTNCESEKEGNTYKNSITLSDNTSDSDEVPSGDSKSKSDNMNISDITSSTHSVSSSSKSSKNNIDHIQSKSKRSKTSAGKCVKTENNDRKITVLEASKLRHKKKKCTVGTSRRNAINIGTEGQFDKFYEVQQKKLERESSFQAASLEIENSRLKLEQDKMERDNVTMMLQQEKLKGEIMKDMAEYNFEVSKKRQELKQGDPSLTDEHLDKILPYRKSIL